MPDIECQQEKTCRRDRLTRKQTKLTLCCSPVSRSGEGGSGLSGRCFPFRLRLWTPARGLWLLELTAVTLRLSSTGDTPGARNPHPVQAQVTSGCHVAPCCRYHTHARPGHPLVPCRALPWADHCLRRGAARDTSPGSRLENTHRARGRQGSCSTPALRERDPGGQELSALGLGRGVAHQTTGSEPSILLASTAQTQKSPSR